MNRMIEARAMLQWDDLRYFLAVAEAGSLSGAARALGSSQPTIGRRVDALERALETRLFERQPRGYALTAAGRSILDVVATMEASSLEITRRVLGLDLRLEGSVRISTTEGIGTAWLVPHLPALGAAWPGIRITVSMEDAAADMARLEADIAIRLFRPEAGDLLARKVAGIGFGLFAARAYLDLRPPPDRPGALSAHDLLGYEESLAHVPEGRWLARQTSGKPPVLRSNSLAALCAAAVAGLGVGLLPRFMAHDHPGLVRLLPDVAVPGRDVWLVAHDDLRTNARVRAVFDFLVDAFAADRRRLAGAD